jgi:hypothetical protein
MASAMPGRWNAAIGRNYPLPADDTSDSLDFAPHRRFHSFQLDSTRLEGVP